MILKEVEFNNFKPYYQSCTINLEPDKDRNVILIGGRNGQGKTSFLVGVVWCLYGKSMSQVDEIFRKEIKNNYSKWLNKSLNWEARNKGETHFSVRIILKDVELSEGFYKNEQIPSEVILERKIDVSDPNIGESFTILLDGKENGLLSEDVEKINFINDYIIPIDIAKFVFFDAEKIAEIAALDTRSRATLMDKSFGQILGLNTYEELILDLKKYESDLKRQEVSMSIEAQLASLEGAKKSNDYHTVRIENEILDIEERLEELKNELIENTNQLIKRGNASFQVNIEDLRKKEKELNEHKINIGIKFNELSDMIPFAILGFKLEEVIDHLDREATNETQRITQLGLKEKTKEFAEKLFNRPVFPDNDIDMDQKTFYYKKAKDLLTELYSSDTDSIELDFLHNLDKSEHEHIRHIYNLTNRNSKDSFEGIFNDFMRIQNDLQEAQKDLRLAESSNKDEFIQDLQDKKSELERENELLIENRGKLINQKDSLIIENNQLETNIKRLLGKVQSSKKVGKQIKAVNKYVKALEEFIKTQKEKKKDILEKSVVTEIKKLLNKPNLVEKVEMNFLKLKDNYGLEVKLFNHASRETNPSTDLSKGEQQLYVSALLKAILSESIHNLPVLIDTPLGRLDQEHRDNILQHYYPYLAEQVIIFSTNTEVRVSDLPKIEKYISKKYRLINDKNKTFIKPEYFK